MRKNFVLFVNSVHAPTYHALRALRQKTGRPLRPVVIVDEKIKESIHSLNDQHHLYGNAMVIGADFDSPASIRQALKPFEGRIFAVTSQFENSIPELKGLIPYLPYLHMPTEASLDWSTDKELMREAFNSYDESLSPKYMQVADASAGTVDAAESVMSYPLIIKPSGLERSLLVSVVHDRKELSDMLSHTFGHLHKAHKTWMKRLEPKVLVEEMMQGDMYSVDTYVAADGTCRHAPLIKVVTGRKVGFDDFFAYLQMSPSGLPQTEVKKACRASEQACKALGLRSITAHTEMMRTPDGWKIIEVGPRVGGYRHELYSLSHGMNHLGNDVLNRAGELPEIPEKPLRYAAIFKTYAQEEGVLDGIKGLDAIRKLPSYVTMKIPFKKGDMLKFAQNNGDAAIEITLCSGSQAQLQTDIRTIEEVLQIRVTAPRTAVQPMPA